MMRRPTSQLMDRIGGGRLKVFTPVFESSASPTVPCFPAETGTSSWPLGARAASVQHLDYPDGDIPCSSKEVERLRSIVRNIHPDVVLLPWFLDEHHANLLYALACGDIEATVLGYEIWSMLEPNAVFDITKHMNGKLSLIRNYPSQLRTVGDLEKSAPLVSHPEFPRE
jgi:LmbE family N-acetylglucosaminyl deacetylase